MTIKNIVKLQSAKEIVTKRSVTCFLSVLKTKFSCVFIVGVDFMALNHKMSEDIGGSGAVELFAQTVTESKVTET